MFKKALTAAFIAAIINVIIFFVANQILPGPILINKGPDTPVEPLSVIAVVAITAIPAFLAALVLWLLQKLTSRGAVVFQILAVIILVASFKMPHGLPGVTLANKLALDLMHVVAASTIVYRLTRKPASVQ